MKIANCSVIVLVLLSQNTVKVSYLYSTGHRALGPIEIDGLFVPTGKAYTLLSDHLITC